MDLPPIDPASFVAAVQPLLAERDLHGLCGLIRSKWKPKQLVDLLHCSHEDARKVAALSLGLVGGKRCIRDLSDRLRDPDPVVNQMAEHALWSIWIRAGNAAANRSLLRGLRELNQKSFDAAIAHFTTATEEDPTFAEAYNQRAIAAYLQERWQASADDCRAATERMPCHFGAWAGLGHCLAHLGRTDEAIASYEKALAIHPHLDCVRQAVQTLRSQSEQT
ncbi:MAG TPA: tetratricopeptide repeat protein [Tepidisphaeraceae bacterium]|nr:tetratricopeptide repeat protein [Tepidisphaeraceae bacterium]